MPGLLGERLVGLCAGKRDVFLAAPYIKAAALRKVLRRLDDRASLSVITKWTPRDLAVGSSDVQCRTIVKDLGGSFLLHPSIHAKYYRAGMVVLVGSANVTGAALGWSARSNVEILCTPGSDFDGACFEAVLLKHSREVGDEEFAYWQKIGNLHTEYHGTEVAVESPALDQWWPRTRDVRNLERAYQGRMEGIASSDERRAVQADMRALRVPPGLEESEFRAWVATALLAAPFTQTVVGVLGVDRTEAARRIAEEWGASLTEARRGYEAAQGWLASLVPGTFGKGKPTARLSTSQD